MTRTDLDAATLACSLRHMAGDGSIEWVMEPIQADVLHDVADMLDENAVLRQQLADVTDSMGRVEERCAKLRELLQRTWDAFHDATAREFVTVKNELRKLGVEVD